MTHEEELYRTFGRFYGKEQVASLHQQADRVAQVSKERKK